MRSAKTASKNPHDAVRAYIAGLPPASRRAVQTVRRTIREAAPDAVEGISYGIIIFKLGGRMLLYCAGWDNHTSVYPLTRGIRTALGPVITKYASGKGTMKFRIDTPIPVPLLKRIVKARIAELGAARAVTRTVARRNV